MWNTVRRAAEQRVSRDDGLALALVCLMRYAGLRVGEVAALQLADVTLSARRGTLIIRRGKGLKRREVPLVAEVREPLQQYLDHRRGLADCWAQRAQARRQLAPAWASWPDGHLFLGQRGPLTERGIREIVAQLGQVAKLDAPLSPHALRHTFATALLAPAAYGLNRPPAPSRLSRRCSGTPTLPRLPATPAPRSPTSRGCSENHRTRDSAGDAMTAIQDTAYPRIRSSLTIHELARIYTPTPDELILARRTTRGMVARICFLVLLKTFQRLGYFISLTDVPPAIVEHIADTVGGTVSQDDLSRCQ